MFSETLLSNSRLLCMVIVHGDCAWWLCMVAVVGDCAWWLCMVVGHGGWAWWLCIVVVVGGCAWWLGMVVVYSGCAWWLWLMIVHILFCTWDGYHRAAISAWERASHLKRRNKSRHFLLPVMKGRGRSNDKKRSPYVVRLENKNRGNRCQGRRAWTTLWMRFRDRTEATIRMEIYTNRARHFLYLG